MKSRRGSQTNPIGLDLRAAGGELKRGGSARINFTGRTAHLVFAGQKPLHFHRRIVCSGVPIKKMNHPSKAINKPISENVKNTLSSF